MISPVSLNFSTHLTIFSSTSRTMMVSPLGFVYFHLFRRDSILLSSASFNTASYGLVSIYTWTVDIQTKSGSLPKRGAYASSLHPDSFGDQGSRTGKPCPRGLSRAPFCRLQHWPLLPIVNSGQKRVQSIKTFYADEGVETKNWPLSTILSKVRFRSEFLNPAAREAVLALGFR